MKKILPEVRLERLVEALSADVAEASDAEILKACADLGIKPEMKGSIAFLGLSGTYFFPYRYAKLSPLPDSPGGPEPPDSPDIFRRQ
jgi:hypothetical protein